MDAVIGIVAHRNDNGYLLNEAYYQQVERCGGNPILLGYEYAALHWLHGLLLTGGGDPHPQVGGYPPSPLLSGLDAERDAFETAIIRAAYRLGLPMLGICRGAQMINCALGGTLYADIGQDVPSEEEHASGQHTVCIAPDSLLYDWFGETVQVNSSHHQAVRRIAPVLKGSAWSPGGIVEGLEGNGRDVLCLQWHPERMGMAEPFAWLIQKARQYRKRSGTVA